MNKDIFVEDMYLCLQWGEDMGEGSSGYRLIDPMVFWELKIA